MSAMINYLVNFPKQRTVVPPFYKYMDGVQVARFPIPDDFYSWDQEFPEYSPNEYTSNVVEYHSISNLNGPEDLSHKEFNPKTKKLEWVKRLGWADPTDINLKVPPNETRKVCMSTFEELIYSNEYIENCLKNAPTNIGAKTYFRKCVNELNSKCVENGTKLRFSYTGPIKFNSDGYPTNPIGRTGLKGRGTLGNWGPNHAADPVVVRADPETGILQFALIKRLDNGECALPGGMVEAGQTISGTRVREFVEEALSGNKKDDESEEEFESRKKELIEKLNLIFQEFTEDDILYQGVVDDPRNTDNSWMETVAILTILTGPNADLKLEAGDDAAKAKWTNYNPQMALFASHKLFINLAVEKMVERGLINQNTETGEYFFLKCEF